MLEPDKILQDNPGSVIFSQYAEQLAQEGRMEEAVEILKKGIQANPYHAPGYSVLAEILFQLESEEEAVDNLLSSIQLDPQMPRDLFRLGAYFRENEPDKGEIYLQSARMYEPVADESALINESIQFSFSAGRTKSVVSVPDEKKSEAGDAGMPADVFNSPESPAFDGSSSQDADEESPAWEREDSDTERGDEETETSDTGGMEQEQYPRQFNDRPVDSSEAVEIDSVENDGKWEVFDEPIVQELDEELDFFDVISEYGKIPRDTEDLGDDFDILNKNRNTDVPVSEDEGIPDIRDISKSEPEEEDDAGAGLDEPVAPEEYGEYQPPQPEEKEAESANVLEINEDEEYNLANFGFEAPVEEDLPVLSDEERFELMSFADSEEDRNEKSPDTKYGLAGLTLEDLGESGPDGENSFSDYLSDEEIEVLSASVSDADDREMVSEEGVNFHDILSAWAPSGDSDKEAPEPEKEESYVLPSAVGMDIEATPETEETEEFEISIAGEQKEPLTEEENSLIQDFLADDGSLSAPEEIPESDAPLNEAIHADMPFYGYHLWFAEAAPPAAPPSTAGAPSGAAVIGGESLEDLISAYQNVLGTPEMSFSSPAIPEARPKSEAGSKSEAAHELFQGEAMSHPAGKGGSYTATMAEIYASQGLLARAVEIYEILIGDNPGNERFRSRLEELKRMREHPADAT
ncbi:MAG: tetratricopeptide repeat protein [Candidatus Latescibacterota bacterium]